MHQFKPNRVSTRVIIIIKHKIEIMHVRLAQKSIAPLSPTAPTRSPLPIAMPTIPPQPLSIWHQWNYTTFMIIMKTIMYSLAVPVLVAPNIWLTRTPMSHRRAAIWYLNHASNRATWPKPLKSHQFIMNYIYDRIYIPISIRNGFIFV